MQRIAVGRLLRAKMNCRWLSATFAVPISSRAKAPFGARRIYRRTCHGARRSFGTRVELMADKAKKSVAEILAAARKADAKGGAAPAPSEAESAPADAPDEAAAPPAAEKPAKPAAAKKPGGGRPSVAEMLAMARGETQTAASTPAPKENPAAKPA